MKIKFNISSILAQLLLLSFVIVWIAPTFGLFISSFRDKDKLAISGWWTSLTTVQVNEIYRTKGKEGQVQEGNYFIIRDNFFNDAKGKKVINFGVTSKKIKLSPPAMFSTSTYTFSDFVSSFKLIPDDADCILHASTSIASPP